MIPSNLASRLKEMMQSVVQPLAPITSIASDLPEFDLGQRFTAQIQKPLPDGTFKALVAGRTITLALPETAKAGDVLELVVTGRGQPLVNAATSTAGQTVQRQVALFAKLAEPADDASPKPKLSQAGQLISQLLTGRFGQPAPVQLAGGQPLMPSGSFTAAQLVPILQLAVKQSGLFYESHQARWVNGEVSLESLRQEPQAREGAQQLAARAAASKPAVAANAALAQQAGPSGADDDVAIQRSAAQLQAAVLADKPTNALRIPDSVMPLVHQQLEALAAHHLAWQGQVWPGQTMQWDMYDPGEHAAASEHEEDKAWRSTLRLTLPALGGVEAQLVLTPAGLALQMRTQHAETAERMRAAQEDLRGALEAAGVPLTGLSVAQDVSA